MGLTFSGGHVAAITPPADGKMTLFVYGTGGLHITHQSSAHSGPWTPMLSSGPQSTQHSFSNVAAPIIYHDGRIALYFAKPGGAGVVIENTLGSRVFTGGYDIFGQAGHNYSALAVAQNQDGRVEVFVINAADGSVWHSWQESRAAHPNLGFRLQPARLGDLTGAKELCVAMNTDGRLEVFATTATRNLVHIWQKAPNSDWSNWETIGHASGEVHVHRGDGDRLAVFAVGDNGLCYWYQDTASHAPWHGPIHVGPANVNHFEVIRNSNGLLEVIGVEGTGNYKWAFHASQTQANLASPWGTFQPIWPSGGPGNPG